MFIMLRFTQRTSAKNMRDISHLNMGTAPIISVHRESSGEKDVNGTGQENRRSFGSGGGTMRVDT